MDEDINIQTAVGTRIPYLGWIDLKLKLSPDDVGVLVPFLVVPTRLPEPIIGTNVMETWVKEGKDVENMTSVLKSSFNEEVDVNTVETFVDTLRSIDDNEVAGELFTLKRDVKVPAGSNVKIKCRTNFMVFDDVQPVIFEPTIKQEWPDGMHISGAILMMQRGKRIYEIVVTNMSSKELVVPSHMNVGTLQLVQSITPLPVKVVQSVQINKDKNSNEDEEIYVSKIYSKNKEEIMEDGQVKSRKKKNTEKEKEVSKIMENVDLRGLTPKQKEKVIEMLYEERDSFSESDDEIGCMHNVQMKINLNSETPVQKRYNTIPRPLYPEIKSYIEDLLNRQWIQYSHSSYSSPIVAVRKKDGELRLCCDYRELNKKTIPDRHPLPRIQNILDSLGGNKWFSLMDQRKAYHQAFIVPES